MGGKNRWRKRDEPHAPLRLQDDDPLVVSARQAEEALFRHYGAQPRVSTVFLPRHGIRVRVAEFGAGDPVVIVPGNTGDGFPFAPLLPELKNRRVILVNRPGGGLSEGMDHNAVRMRTFAVETLTAVLDALGLEKVPIIAHSMGGYWSLWLAIDRPERVASLCLFGVGSVTNSQAPFVLRLTSIRGLNRLLFRLIMPRSRDRALRSLSFMGHSEATRAKLPEAMAECYFRFQRLPHYKIASLSLMESTNRLGGPHPDASILPEELPRISQPTLLLLGSNDPFGNIPLLRQNVHDMPNAKFSEIPNAGHLPWLDAPAKCGELINAFLAETES